MCVVMKIKLHDVMGGTGWQLWEVREASGKKSLQLIVAITIVLKPQRSFFKLSTVSKYS